MKRIIKLTEADLTRIVKRVMRESVSAVEPIANPGSGFKVFFDEGKSELNLQAKRIIIDDIKSKLRSSMDTIEEFYDSKDFKIPKFIQVGAATSSTGSREANAAKAQERINVMVECIYDAFDELGQETGNVVGADYIKTFLTTNTDSTYKPSGLKKLYDANKSAPKAEERYAYVIIKPLSKRGKTKTQIGNIEDMLRIARGYNINPDEEGIAKAICRLETYSDITDLNYELRDKGGLEYFINTSITNGLTGIGSDNSERRQIKFCLNKASKRSGKGEIADIAGDKLTIIGI